VVIDGAIRDSAKIARSRLPVFARAIVAGAGGAEYAGELQVPIQCGGVVVNPGDWLVGDEDGVVAIPAARL
jgi:regulator of RNase E activity RraA